MDKNNIVCTLKKEIPVSGVVLKSQNLSASLYGEVQINDIEKYFLFIKMLEFNGRSDFPTAGEERTLYIDKSENKLYRYDKDNHEYYVLGSDYNKIQVISSTI